MNNFKITKIFVSLTILLTLVCFADAQKRGKTNAQTTKPKPIIFAVTDDGTTLEPIGVFEKGELIATTGGDGEPKDLTAFANSYYKPKTVYKLIFGGAANGTVTVKSSNTNAECGKNLATVVTSSPKSKLKGLVMALATSDAVTRTGGARRVPTAAERAEIETLVRDELIKQGASANAVKNLHYHNLTAVDVDNDGNAEMVGSYYADTSAKERNQIFFIADKGAGGKYEFGLTNYEKITPDKLMSGAAIKDLNGGTYSELLLDTFEYNGDKSDEIFTVTPGFEGSSFNVYSKQNGKWTKVFEGSNYHCAY